MRDPIVLLHGFGGTHRAWDGVIAHLDADRFEPIALDLPGHGSAARDGQDVTFAGCVQSVLERSPPRFHLCGYSLGGRIALHVALAAPGRVTRLLLVSASPGIEDAGERARRRAADHELAKRLESEPYADFIERWRSQPIFAGEPPAAAALARAEQRRNRPGPLAAALRGIGAGEMQPLWERLGELAMPVVLVHGTRDERYAAIAARMIELIPRARPVAVEGGHGLVLERPDAVATAIEERRATPPAGAQAPPL